MSRANLTHNHQGNLVILPLIQYPTPRVVLCHHCPRLINCNVFSTPTTVLTLHPQVFYRPVFYSPPRPALPASLDCSVFLSHAGVFLSLHLCSQAFLISCTDPTASPTPKFPQHILCASCSPGLLCFTVMCLPVWLSIYTAKSLTLGASNASS